MHPPLLTTKHLQLRSFSAAFWLDAQVQPSYLSQADPYTFSCLSPASLTVYTQVTDLFAPHTVGAAMGFCEPFPLSTYVV